VQTRPGGTGILPSKVNAALVPRASCTQVCKYKVRGE